MGLPVVGFGENSGRQGSYRIRFEDSLSGPGRCSLCLEATYPIWYIDADLGRSYLCTSGALDTAGGILANHTNSTC